MATTPQAPQRTQQGGYVPFANYLYSYQPGATGNPGYTAPQAAASAPSTPQVSSLPAPAPPNPADRPPSSASPGGVQSPSGGGAAGGAGGGNQRQRKAGPQEPGAQAGVNYYAETSPYQTISGFLNNAAPPGVGYMPPTASTPAPAAQPYVPPGPNTASLPPPNPADRPPSSASPGGIQSQSGGSPAGGAGGGNQRQRKQSPFQSYVGGY